MEVPHQIQIEMLSHKYLVANHHIKHFSLIRNGIKQKALTIKIKALSLLANTILLEFLLN